MRRPFKIVEPDSFITQVEATLGCRAWDELKFHLEIILATGRPAANPAQVAPNLSLVYDVDEANGEIIYKELN